MIIKSIELENIRSYKKEVISFDAGINFLSGDIGSGKSTILLAIEFAFFGFKKGDLEGYELLRKGENNASIKLVLEDAGKIFEIYRSVKKHKSSDLISQEVGYVIDDGNLIELAPKELNAYVFGLLNFPREFLTKNKNLVYRFSVYTPQENLKSILFDTSESRLEVIRKIFRIDKYKQLLDSFDIFLKKVREDKKVFEVKLERKVRILDEINIFSDKIKSLEKDVKKFESEDFKLRGTVKKYKDAIGKREVLLDKFSKNLLILEKKKSSIIEIEKQITNLNIEILDIENDKKHIQNMNIFGQSDVSSDSFDKKKIKLDLKVYENLISKLEIDLKKKFIKKEDLKLSLKLRDDLILKKQEIEKDNILFENKKLELTKLTSSFDYMHTKCQVKDLENYILKDKVRFKKLTKVEVEFNEVSKSKIECNLDFNNLSEKLSLIDDKIKNISKIDFCDNCLQKVSKEHRIEIEKNLKKEKLVIKSLILDGEKNSKILDKKLKILENEMLGFGKLRDDLIQKEERIIFLYEKESKEKSLNEDLKNLQLDIEELNRIDVKKDLKNLNLKISEFKKNELEIEKIDLEERKLLNEISMKRIDIKDIEQKIIDFKNLDSILKKKNDLHLSLITKIKVKKEIFDKIIDFEIREKKLQNDKSLLKEKYEVYLLKSNNLALELVKVKTDLKFNLEVSKRNEKDLIEITKIEKDYSKLLFNETFLKERASSILLQIERSVFSKYYAEFNDEFEKLFRELIEDNDIDVRLNSEFSPVIEQNGYDVDVRNLSGGEKSSLAIAYRLGLKKIIESNFDSKQKLSLLILDEPTDGFSNEQIDRLGNILKDTKLKQIILVSHDEKIESIADIVLHVEKTNHKSQLV